VQSLHGMPFALTLSVASTRYLGPAMQDNLHVNTSASECQSPNACSLKTDPRHNRVLRALPSGELGRWQPHLELVSLNAGTTLHRWGEHPRHVYFPVTASVSMLRTTREGGSVEIIGVGNEGLVGIPVIMGGGSSPGDAVVRVQGLSYRMASAWLHSEFLDSPAVMGVLLRYTHAMMTHTAQSALCNQLHSLEKRLCRCFLGSLDHVNGAPLNLTHDSLASMLGVRREGVTGAALKLQRAGLIDYARGRVEVLDRKGLEACSCECYRVVRNEYERLLGSPSLVGTLSLPWAAQPGKRPAPSAPLPASAHRHRRGELSVTPA
jgi:CRP-like cAMP-binding protein